jgi:hypothetical protein
VNDVRPDAPATDPRWLEAALGELRERISPWTRTLAGFALRPRRFVAGWLDGSVEPMNPLGFMAASVAALSVASQVLADLGHGERQSRLFDRVIESAAPYLYYAALGLLAHLALRSLGARRRWTSTLAVALWAGAAMPTLALLGAETFVALAHVLARSDIQGAVSAGSLPLWANVGVTSCLFLAYVWFLISFGRGLLGLHPGWGWAIATILVVLVVLTALSGPFIHLPVLHPSVTLNHGHFGVSLSN